LKLELLSPAVDRMAEQAPARVSTYLKLELLSQDPDEKALGKILRFHLFEAGAFVTAGRWARRFSTCSRFHLFEAGAFVTHAKAPRPPSRPKCVSTYLKLELLSPIHPRETPTADLERFHLFEAGAFVTTGRSSTNGSSSRVSTYLKLELLSLVVALHAAR